MNNDTKKGTRGWECFCSRWSVPMWKTLTLGRKIVRNPSV